jgi:hypothetical protein
MLICERYKSTNDLVYNFSTIIYHARVWQGSFASIPYKEFKAVHYRAGAAVAAWQLTGNYTGPVYE